MVGTTDLPMNLKIASLIINNLCILRFQGFKARTWVGRILPPAQWLPKPATRWMPQILNPLCGPWFPLREGASVERVKRFGNPLSLRCWLAIERGNEIAGE